MAKPKSPRKKVEPSKAYGKRAKTTKALMKKKKKKKSRY